MHYPYDGDPYRVAHALWLWRRCHEAGGPGAEPEPEKHAARLAELLGVQREYAIVSERLGGMAVKKARRRA